MPLNGLKLPLESEAGSGLLKALTTPYQNCDCVLYRVWMRRGKGSTQLLLHTEKGLRARAAASQAWPGVRGTGSRRLQTREHCSNVTCSHLSQAQAVSLALCSGSWWWAEPGNQEWHQRTFPAMSHAWVGRKKNPNPRTSVSHLAFSYSKEGFNTKLCRRFIF